MWSNIFQYKDWQRLSRLNLFKAQALNYFHGQFLPLRSLQLNMDSKKTWRCFFDIITFRPELKNSRGAISYRTKRKKVKTYEIWGTEKEKGEFFNVWKKLPIIKKGMHKTSHPYSNQRPMPTITCFRRTERRSCVLGVLFSPQFSPSTFSYTWKS